MHRVLIHDLPEPAAGSLVSVEGDEAQHALRVKRLEAGSAVVLMDGRGLVVEAEITGFDKLGRSGGKSLWRMTARATAVERFKPARPEVRVLAPAPKGPRVDAMVEQLSQVGASSWSPLIASRTVVDPREKKLHRLERVCDESAKQCGRAWAMEIGKPTRFADAIKPRDGEAVLVADASGGAMPTVEADVVRVVIGPEGGLTNGELEKARDAGASIVKLGPNVMRLETAAVVATAMVTRVVCSNEGVMQ
ncbi:MAG: RsmE family RNA methyltransferase [Planctomycetota bacterium]